MTHVTLAMFSPLHSAHSKTGLSGGSMGSHVWKFFKVSDQDVRFAICTICRTLIPRGGSNEQRFNTTNLIRHLRTRHTAECAEYYTVRQPKPAVSSPPKLSGTSSHVWEFFKVSTEDIRFAICNVCSSEISRGGNNQRRFNTTNLIRHLRACHTTELSEYESIKPPKPAVSSSSGGTQTSPVWKFFKVSDKDVKFAICNVCGAKISRGGSDQHRFNTTNMIKHLRTCHTDEYDKYYTVNMPSSTSTRCGMSSPAWIFFKVSNKDARFAICNICRAEISRGGSNQQRFNTTNIIRHLRIHHTAAFAEYETVIQPEPDISSSPSLRQLTVVGGRGAAGKATSSSIMSGHGSWDVASDMDQITVVRIDDTHIAEEQCLDGGKLKGSVEFHEVEYTMPTAEEEEVVTEEEEDSVFVIEYSNPEEEGESYQFTMSVDRSLNTEKPIVKHPAETTSTARPVTSRPQRTRQKRRWLEEEEDEEEEEEEVVKVMSNKCVLALGEDYDDMMALNSGEGLLVCPLCPPPGRSFKRGSGLAVHMKHMHLLEGNKTFFCTTCEQSVRTQVELDTHTKRHANQDAVFTCPVCPAEGTGFKGTKMGLRKHLEKEHPGLIPRCHICNKGFCSVTSYLADQFRHVGVSPYYCAQCQIYEMTERGLMVHIRNHDKKKKRKKKMQLQEAPEVLPQAPEVGNKTPTDNSEV